MNEHTTLMMQILNKELFGQKLMEELGNISNEEHFWEKQNILFLKQLMESVYFALNSKNKKTASSRFLFAKEVYQDRILVNKDAYPKEVLEKVLEVLEEMEVGFSKREW